MSKAIPSILAIAATVVLLAGCALPSLVAVAGSGNLVTQEEPYTDFDRVEDSHAFEVNIRQGDDYSTVITIDDNLLQYLRVNRSVDTLKISLDPNRPVSSATLRADITMPRLTGLNLSGASEVTIAGFESAGNLDVGMSGASQLTGNIQTGDAEFNVSGASRVVLNGAAEAVTIDVSGGSKVDLADFAVSQAIVVASGASEATVCPNDTLDANASGASTVYFLGDPTLRRVNASGASTIEGR